MIYLDNAATTAVCRQAREGMAPFLEDKFGNPSANYPVGREGKSAIENARRQIAGIINVRPKNIIFTSGGTESDNAAIMKIKDIENAHIITSKIEHHAVLDTCKYAEKLGAEVTYLGVNREGEINLDELEKSIRRNTRLISIMFANNEIGTIEPVAKIGKIARAYGIPFHTDAVQAFGHVPINVEMMNVDMLSVSAHKFNGPKGVGFLYVRNIDDFEPFIWGGGQENGKRSGTENTAGIVGMEKAAIHAARTMNYRMRKEQQMRNYFVSRITNEIEDVVYNGHKFKRLPGNANFSFKNVNAAKLVNDLAKEDICISAGSACAASGGEPSHVIQAINVPEEYAYGTIRITLSHENTREELDFTIDRLKERIKEQRK